MAFAYTHYAGWRDVLTVAYLQEDAGATDYGPIRSPAV